MKQIITLTTDFGFDDFYIGAMKGVILSINNNAEIIDISHGIKSYDISSTAFFIHNYYKFYPKGTIHVVVVDPGVGTERKAVLVDTGDYFFIGPDNGIFTFIYKLSDQYEIFELNNSNYFLDNISTTFHGRDIFSPVASHLSKGVTPQELGDKTENPVVIDINNYYQDADLVVGEIIYSDKFGNLISNIPSDIVNDHGRIYISGRMINGISESFSSGSKGELLAVKGSSGYIEICVNQGSAENIISEKKIKIDNGKFTK